MTTLAALRPRRTVTTFWRLAPTPTPDSAGLARWIDRARAAIAPGPAKRGEE